MTRFKLKDIFQRTSSLREDRVDLSVDPLAQPPQRHAIASDRRRSLESLDGSKGDTAEMAFSSDGMSTDSNATYIISKKRASLSDSPTSEHSASPVSRDSIAAVRSREPRSRRERANIHAIQIPLVSEEQRRPISQKETKKPNFFRGLAQRLKQHTISRGSRRTLSLVSDKKRRNSIGCESTRSISFTRPPLRGTIYGAPSVGTSNNSTVNNNNRGGNSFNSDGSYDDRYKQSGLRVPFSFSESHLDQAPDIDEDFEFLDSHESTLKLRNESPTPIINPSYESVYKTRSLENILPIPLKRYPEWKRYSEIPPLPEHKTLLNIPSPVAEEVTPRSSAVLDANPFQFISDMDSDDEEDRMLMNMSRHREGPITSRYIVPDSPERRRSASPDAVLLRSPRAKKPLSKRRSRTLEISGPFNPVHLEGNQRPPSRISTEENMRRYREIFGSVPTVSVGKRSRAGSAMSGNKAKQYLRNFMFFPMRKAMSEESARFGGAKNWEEIAQFRMPRATTLNNQQQVPDIRQQLNEQLKWLDTRVDSQASIVTEIQEYFRRRAEVEIEYSKQLDKLAKQLLLKHKSEKPKREQWHLFSSYQCWLQLINTTRKQSSDHAKVAEVYQNHLTSRLLHVAEDVQRVYRKCRNIGIDEHEELLKILHELHTTMKTYHSYWALEQQAASKLSVVETNLNKLEQGLPKDKVAKSRRYRLLNKERLKRWEKSEEARVKALKARNDYVLCVEAANAAVQKYFVDDVSDLIDAMDFGFHTSLSRCLLMYNSTLECQHKSLKGSQDAMKKCLETLDSRADKQKFLESYNTAFMAPPKFTFQTHKGDVSSLKVVNVDRAQVQVEDAIFEDMEQRFRQLQNRLSDLKIENEEVWKTLETAEKTLMNMIESRNYDMSAHFDSSSDQPQVSILNSAVPSSIGGHSMEFKTSSQSNFIPKTPETAAIKLRADKQETEDFYLEKFREYSTQCSIIARLQARYDCMENAMTQTSGVERARSNCGAVGPPKRPRRKRIGRQAVTGQPKLFGGSLEEYAEATNQDIPLIIRSCIRVINLYGLHHQGVFRVSGSQVEINNFREAFERGEDPLADISDASDINSVAGVLKLYLRELREPLFPIFYFDQLMEISQLTSKEREKEFISRAKDVVKTLPRPSFAVLRFLFAFLNHLSELSDENMMCPYNLAICFGPTLLPIPEDKNPVQYQPLVNELIKGLIIHQEEIFPASEYGGILYEKYISSSEDQAPEDLDSPSDVSQTNITLETEEPLNNTDDDLVNDEPEISINLFGKEDVLEVVAQYDFTARHQRELSFKRGDVIHLTEHLSADWWKGSLRGQQGLVPDKYIMLNIRDENREGSQRDKTSSSSDSLGSPSSQREPNSTTSTKSANSPNGSLSSLTAEPRFRRRSLSPSSTGDRSPGQPSSATMSLKRRLRASASVGDATGDSSSSPSSSLEEGSPLTGAISRLRRQSPLRGHRQPTVAPQRRGIHGDFESSANLARDLSEALNDVINNLNVSNDQASEPEVVPEQSVAADTPVVVKSLKKDAPDLVQDLPPTLGGSSGGEDEMDHVAPSQPPDAVFIEKPQTTNLLTTDSRSQNLSTAERFAMTNQCTMRKGSPRPSARNGTHVVVLKGSTSASTSPQSTLHSTPPPNGNPARRSSCGSVSPILSITGQSPSVQKLKRMFSEPDRTQGPPLSPKPALKAKPVTLLKLNSRKHPPVSPRATPPKNQENLKEVSPLENDLIVREYRQTSC